MSQPVNVYEAKTRLSELLDRVLAGEDVIIARNGKPIARLVPVEARKPREPGMFAHLPFDDTGFDDPLPEEELAAWEGRS